MLNPYALLAIVISALGLAAGSFTFGVKFARGQEARAERLVLEARKQAELGAAEAIANNKPVQQIIKQRLETEIREVPVYINCRNTPDVMWLLNDALANRQRADSGGMPAADAAD